jgi:hypothetical protein
MTFRNIRNPRPCQRCRKLHIRCVASPNSSSCQKCIRHKWECIPVNPLRSLPRSVRKQSTEAKAATTANAPSPSSSSSSSISTPGSVHSDLGSPALTTHSFEDWQASVELDIRKHVDVVSPHTPPDYHPSIRPPISDMSSSWDFAPKIPTRGHTSSQPYSWSPYERRSLPLNPPSTQHHQRDSYFPPVPCELFMPRGPNYVPMSRHSGTYDLPQDHAPRPMQYSRNQSRMSLDNSSPLCICLNSNTGQCFCSPVHHCGCAYGSYAKVHCYNMY